LKFIFVRCISINTNINTQSHNLTISQYQTMLSRGVCNTNYSNQAIFRMNNRLSRPKTAISSYNTRIRLREIIKTALNKNKKIAIISSSVDIRKGYTYEEDSDAPLSYQSRPESKYTINNRIVYDAQINSIYEELTNEILGDVESCVYDYPETYVSIVLTERNDKITKKSETLVVHFPEK